MANDDILVIDDSLLMREVTRQALEAAGYSVRIANDGQEGLAALDQKTPDLIISDVVMRGLDGYELCRRIRRTRHGADVPIILMTSQFGPNERVAGYEAGADDFL